MAQWHMAQWHMARGCRVKQKFLVIAISGNCLGILEGSHGSHRATLEPMCLPTMTQAGREHATQCISLVHADMLCTVPQIFTLYDKYIITLVH